MGMMRSMMTKDTTVMTVMVEEEEFPASGPRLSKGKHQAQVASGPRLSTPMHLVSIPPHQTQIQRPSIRSLHPTQTLQIQLRSSLWQVSVRQTIMTSWLIIQEG